MPSDEIEGIVKSTCLGSLCLPIVSSQCRLPIVGLSRRVLMRMLYTMTWWCRTIDQCWIVMCC
jgi:hypothetical protein